MPGIKTSLRAYGKQGCRYDATLVSKGDIFKDTNVYALAVAMALQVCACVPRSCHGSGELKMYFDYLISSHS